MLKYVLIGTSVLALAAGSASAQVVFETPGATTEIYTQGNGNTATTTKTSDNTSVIFVRQVGDNNTVTGTQTGGDTDAGGPLTFNRIRIYQEDQYDLKNQPGGDPTLTVEDNVVNFTQGGSGNRALVDQVGVGNTLDLTMAGVPTAGGVNNLNSNFQAGDENGATININGELNYSRAVQGGELAETYQPVGTPGVCTTESSCVYTFIPDSDRNVVDVTFDAAATNSTSNIWQSASDNYAEVTISGDSSRSEIQQQGDGTALGGNNYALVTIPANFAVSEVYQSGISNRATVTLNNNGSHTIVTQNGNLNNTTVTD